MELDQTRLIAIGCCIIGLVMMMAIPFCQMRATQDAIEESMEGGEDPFGEVTLPEGGSARGEERTRRRIPLAERRRAKEREEEAKPFGQRIRALMRAKRFEEALALCAATIDGRASDEDAEQAKSWIGRAWAGAHRDVVAAERWDDARRLIGEAEAEHLATDGEVPSRDELRQIRKSHLGGARARVLAALGAGDADEIDRILAAVTADEHVRELPRREVAEHLMARWTAAREAGDADAAGRLLTRAAAVVAAEDHLSWGARQDVRDTIVETTLAATLTIEELDAGGEAALDRGEHALATCLLMAIPRHAGYDALVGGEPFTSSVRWNRRARLARAILGLARDVEAGKLRWVPPDAETNVAIRLAEPAKRLARDLRGRHDAFDDVTPWLDLAREANELQLAVQLGRARRLAAAKVWFQVASQAEDFLEDHVAHQYLPFLRSIDEAFDPFEGAPADVRPHLEAWAKKGGAGKDNAVAKALLHGLWFPERVPGAREAFTLMWEARAHVAIDRNDYARMRGVLRNVPESDAATRVRDHLYASIRATRSEGRWADFYRLGGFFVAELGDAIPAAMRDELGESLREAAAHFEKSGEPMARVFMLSLRAELLAGSAEGDAAHAEAMRLGFEAVERLAVHPDEKPATTLPSGLDGLGVEAVRNMTSEHMMLFYEGPERFFIRLGPWRRGCVVLKDGAYVKGVIVTDRDVTPYKGEVAIESEYLGSSFYIDRPGIVPPEPLDADLMMGDWTLLRVPPDADGAFELTGAAGPVGFVSHRK